MPTVYKCNNPTCGAEFLEEPPLVLPATPTGAANAIVLQPCMVCMMRVFQQLSVGNLEPQP